jgi:hypothetical protein
MNPLLLDLARANLDAMSLSEYPAIREAAARALANLPQENMGCSAGCSATAVSGGAETAQAAVRPAVTISLADYVDRHDQIPVDPDAMPNPCDRDAYLKWYYARPGGYSGD